ATLEDGKYYVEDPENIWTPVGDDGLLDENNMIWGGPDGLPSGLDNEPVDKIGDEYWVHVGQNVWRKYLKNSPKGPLGPLTGGGPDGDPTTDPVTEIYDNTDNDGRYYVGPLGPDEDNNMYYYGDPQTGGNGTLDSTANGLEKDDVKYYKDKNGNMTTTKPTKPLPENPEVTDQGRELVTSKTGDTANWLEIARYGDYSLIIRKDFINVLPNHKGEMTWQTLSFGKTNDYQKSRVRDAINDWFNGRSTGDNLVANARLRSFTVSNNAYSVLGTGSSDTGGLSNGFSKPTGNKIGDGNDITFLLSFTEAANFISTEYASSFTGGVYLASNASAVKNFGKLTAQEAGSGIWLRTPGTNDLSASSLQHVFGRVYQFLLESLQGLAYPALWVHQDIFE
ncbi:MAG: hypothetical protein FWG61_01635, partial [Firmicutes bacterium]|nr:hypothetical protein [Bacillota bacterium]